MKILHYIPAEEEDLHDFDCDCVCGPTHLPPHKIGAEQDKGEIVYEHYFFLPLVNERTNLFIVREVYSL